MVNFHMQILVNPAFFPGHVFILEKFHQRWAIFLFYQSYINMI
jgi:hypothetical protein